MLLVVLFFLSCFSKKNLFRSDCIKSENIFMQIAICSIRFVDLFDSNKNSLCFLDSYVRMIQFFFPRSQSRTSPYLHTHPIKHKQVLKVRYLMNDLVSNIQFFFLKNCFSSGRFFFSLILLFVLEFVVRLT
jgi:hypothetical protein